VNMVMLKARTRKPRSRLGYATGVADAVDARAPALARRLAVVMARWRRKITAQVLGSVDLSQSQQEPASKLRMHGSIFSFREAIPLASLLQKCVYAF